MKQIFLLVSAFILAAMITVVHGVCDIGLCPYEMPTNLTREQECTWIRSGIPCAQTNFLSNAECNEGIKMIAKEKITEGRKYLNDHCGGNGGVAIASSLSLCLGLAGLTYILTSINSNQD